MPNIPFIFFSFRIMVILGFSFIVIFIMLLYLAIINQLHKHNWLLRLGIWSFPLAFIASMAGWIVAEVGRQPWTIQGLLPTMLSTSNINANAVILTFWMFLTVLTILVVAEIKIMKTAISKGPHKLKGGPDV
jgi:cytochrome bd ubiquinol oxidase subunit I